MRIPSYRDIYRPSTVVGIGQVIFSKAEDSARLARKCAVFMARGKRNNESINLWG
jgi:hypothetical protein